MSEKAYKNIFSFLSALMVPLLLALGWLAFPTNLFISHTALFVDGTTVKFVRQTPFGTVLGRWRAEIVVLDGSHYECRSVGWENSVYQHRESNTVTYEIGDWALDCIERGEDYTITTTRQVLLFGILPLRPSTYVDTVRAK